MLEEYEKQKRKRLATMRSLMDYGMGFIILVIGLVFFFRDKFGNISLNERFPPDSIDKIFGGFCIVYGAWRIYRGYQKKYFK
ncbi:MAG: hypothetical protein KBF82_11685 [Chitinophagaceae bacterium]|nr:hypothetical protein [Chitinophagaceae bacterium]MBP9104520.1 hypothetical protein [Chitinophagaceae bacterium]